MRISFLFPALFILNTVAAQLPQVPFDLPGYTFIQYNANQLELVHNNSGYINLFAKFDTLMRTGQNQIRIVHLGGSHIQADIYTHRIRQELQSLYPGMLGARGFIFPFKIARTNSPSNLKISYTGEWLTSKNTQPDTIYPLGVSGITSALISKTGSLNVIASFDTVRRYDFNRIRIFCNSADLQHIPVLYPENLVKAVTIDYKAKCVQYELNSYSDSLNVYIYQHDTLQPFELYGISLDNDDPGVIYNSIGVNGAMLKSYLRCGLFSSQMEALNPDWVIISIGTNEGNTRKFDEAAYRREYLSLLDTIRKAAPGTAILLTVPNDSYLQKKYINHNTSRIREIIFDIAEDNNCGVWDFYTIMGGLNSAKAWFNNGLMSKDHIHFNKQGYLLKGNLFYAAFLRSWNDPSFTHLTEFPSPTPLGSDIETPLSASPIP